MNQHARPKVAVVGGGLSGLATAVQIHLADPNLDLTLFEAADRCGGVIHTELADPFLIDHGADMFATSPPAALELCRRLGVADQLIEPNFRGRGAMIVYQGRPVPIPDGFVLMRATKLWPMLTTPLLSPIGKLRFLCERWIAARPGSDDESVADFVRRRMGAEILDRLVGPLTAGIYTADVEKLSMLATMKTIAQMESEFGSLARATAVRHRTGKDSDERMSAGARYGRFRAFRNGSGQLIRSLEAALPKGTIRTGCPVHQLDRYETDERFEGATGQWQLNREDHRYDHVVVATPPSIAADLFSIHAIEAAETLREIESASTAIVVLAVHQQQITRPVETFGMVVPPVEKRNVLAVSFASQKFAGRAPQDHVLIRVFIGGALQPHLLQQEDEQLVRLAREELGQLIGLTGQPVLTRVVRWNDAMPQYHVGHLQRVEKIESSIAQVPGLHLMTNALHGVGIAPVIESAGKVAGAVVQQLSTST